MASQSEVTLVPNGDGFLAKRCVNDVKRKSYKWEWLTLRGWKRVRGGSHGHRRPKDAVVLRVTQ